MLSKWHWNSYFFRKIKKSPSNRGFAPASTTTDREQRQLAEKDNPKYIFTIPRAVSSQVNWPRQTDCKQTDCEPTILLQWFRHWFCLSQSEGLGKMALGIVKIYLGSPF